MAKLLSVFLLLLAGFSWAYPRLDFSPEPCAEPITYSIGSFDRRFNLSQADFLKALTRAEAVWETPSQRELFSYAPEGGLTVNLVYDYRQQTTEELAEIEEDLLGGEAAYRALETRYKRLKSEQSALGTLYDQRLAEFEAKKALYDEHVEVWNESSRTSKDEFEALERERQALEIQSEALQALGREVNTKVAELNLMVDRLNTLGQNLNFEVEEYNAVGALRGETFAGGTYTSDREGERIDIFEFENMDTLVRTLAHELGHALGLEHVPDPEAIMYYLNEDAAARASAADLEALSLLCGVE